MRVLAILTLLFGFVSAVLLPHNDVGTHGLPALDGKVAAKSQPGKAVEPAAKSSPVGCLVTVEIQIEASRRLSESVFWSSIQAAGNVQLNLPLLI
jgi:hypothetical protein